MAGIASGLVQNLLEKVSAKAYEEISLAYNVKSHMKKLKRTMLSIENVLLDAEEKQNHDHHVSQWLEVLRDTLYDAEDVLDEFECEALQRKMVKQQRSISKKVGHFFSITSNPIIYSFKMAHRIKEMNEALNDIETASKKFNLVEKKAEYDFKYTVREMTHSFVDSSYVFGRDNNKEWIIRHLLYSDIDEKLSVISLVGIGGLGKTTLAQLVYNDEKVDKHFAKKMWVCVSVDFNVQRLIKEIFGSAIDSEVSDKLAIDHLQRRLRKQLGGQRFLLILDDVWNQDNSKWQNLKPLLMVGATGSKILVTTRMDSVAKIMSKDELKHELEGLDEKDSWCLFAKFAFGDKKEEEIPYHLKRIGETIVEKCKGVPLAIKSLGSLLYSKTNFREWEYVRDNEIWKLREKDDGILPALKLSYQLMPSYLKPCFVYCALFPKDHIYSIEEVIHLWMANGLLLSENGREELEDIGQRYLEELFSRSLFQHYERKGIPAASLFNFKIHDLVHDLARSIGQDKYFTTELQLNTKSILDNVQHIYISNLDDTPHLQRLKKVRSFLAQRRLGGPDEYYFVFKKFLLLRVLKMNDLECKSLPHEMGMLKHLRYLAFYNSDLESLPNSICELQSLQTLILQSCKSIKALPRDMRNLISLRYLLLGIGYSETYGHEVLGRIEGLSNLRSLSIYRIYGEIGLEGDENGSNQKVIQSRLRSLQFVTCALPFRTIPKWFQRFANTLRLLEITDVYIHTFPKWFIELTSLETLMLISCPELSSLPDGIEHMSTLQLLVIIGCDVFNPRWEPETSKEWHKIAHIPTIQIDDKIFKRNAY